MSRALGERLPCNGHYTRRTGEANGYNVYFKNESGQTARYLYWVPDFGGQWQCDQDDDPTTSKASYVGNVRLEGLTIAEAYLCLQFGGVPLKTMCKVIAPSAHVHHVLYETAGLSSYVAGKARRRRGAI